MAPGLARASYRRQTITAVDGGYLSKCIPWDIFHSAGVARGIGKLPPAREKKGARRAQAKEFPTRPRYENNNAHKYHKPHPFWQAVITVDDIKSKVYLSIDMWVFIVAS
jgi:hypothetical protein